MSWDIWFVPSNTSHVGKNRLLLSGLRDRGCRVHMLCLDEIQHQIFSTRPQMDKSGFPFEVLSAGRFRRDRHWLLQGLHRRELLRILRQFFASHKVDAMIFGADSGIASRTTGDVARSLGIPSVLVVDGLIAPPNPRYRPGLHEQLRGFVVRQIRRFLRAGGVGRTSRADLLLLMNELGRRVLIQWGISANRLRVVGSPEYDELASRCRDQSDKEYITSIRQRLNIAPDRPIVLFAHQDIGLDRELLRCSFRRMVTVARQVGGTVLVKFHPRGRDRPEEWSAWASAERMNTENILFLSNECTSVEAVMICSVCVTFFSTVSIEAMVYGKPVIFMTYHHFPETLCSADMGGAAIDADSPEELQKHIAALLADVELRRDVISKAGKYLEKDMFGLDGRSVDRSVESVLEILSKLRQSAGQGYMWTGTA